MQETRDIAALEATIASLESQIESLSRDNEALAAENRRLAADAVRAAEEAACTAAESQAALAEKDRAYAQLRSEHDKLVELVKMANAREFGAKSERVLPHQISLFNDLEACAPAPPPEPAPGVAVSFIFTGFSFLVLISQNKDSGEPLRIHSSNFSAGLKPSLQIGGANAPDPPKTLRRVRTNQIS